MANDERKIEETPISGDGKLSFSFTATARNGKTVIDRVVANSSDHAWSLLESQGFHTIQLLDNENSAIKNDDKNSRRRLVFSAKEEQELRKQRSMLEKTLWSLFRPGNLWTWVPLTVWLLYEIAKYGWPSSASALPAAALATFFIWFAWARVPSIMYDLALHASAWGQWAEVERWMHRIARWKRWFNTPFAGHELLFRTATAEAGQGRLNDALRRVAPLANDKNLAPGFYQARLASLFCAAKDFHQMAQAQQEACNISATDSRKIDVATTLARYLDNPHEAKEILEGIDSRKLAPTASIFFLRCQGIIALETNEPAIACDYFARALTISRTYVGSPLMQGMILDTRAYYGLALTAIGQAEAAAAHFTAARRMIEARGDTKLLARCDAAQRKNR